MDDLEALLARIPEGWSRTTYDGRRWGVSRTTGVGGRVERVYAEELGGSDVVSANVYRVGPVAVLKPCEMAAEKVLAFLRGAG